MKVKANAKINLTLDITGKRDDGYHIIDSVFQSVALCDELSVEKADKITVCCDVGEIENESNIAFRAAQIFFEQNNIAGGAKITVKKHIPLTSGMGGGSADAAAVISALDIIYKTKLSKKQLRRIALLSGADVPFCITGGTARVGGVGEKIEELPAMPDCGILLLKHGVKQSTADMYKKIDAYPQKKRYTDAVVGGIINEDLNVICNNVSNAFSGVCNNTEIIDAVNTTNPLCCSVSGSGPTVFAIYNSKEQAENASKQLKNMGYCPMVTQPISKGIMFE